MWQVRQKESGFYQTSTVWGFKQSAIAAVHLQEFFSKLQSPVYKDSLRSQLVAIVILDLDMLLPWARERSMPQDVSSLYT
jgi:hypothetical protein